VVTSLIRPPGAASSPSVWRSCSTSSSAVRSPARRWTRRALSGPLWPPVCGIRTV